MRHPQRNIIGRDVGSQFLEGDCNNYVETATFPLNHRSTLLLCSDGLCDMVMSMQMADVLSTDLDVEQKANALIAAANKAGGKDNVTVVLVDINFPDEDETVEVEEAADNGIESLGDIEIVPVNEDEESDVKTDGADKTDEADKTPADAKKKDEPKAKNSHKSLVVILVLLLIIVALGMFIVGYVYSDVVKTKAAAQAVIEQPVVEEPIIQNDTTKSDTLQLQQSVEAKE